MLAKALGAVWRALRVVLIAVAALVIFIEEWGWRPLAAAAAALARWAPWRRLEARIAASPPRVAMALFIVPAGLLFPVKLAALWLIDAGRPWLGVGIIMAAKLIGTALVGRLFILVEPQLMQFAWFARLLGWWRQIGARVRAVVRRSFVWRHGRVLGRACRQWLHRSTG